MRSCFGTILCLCLLLIIFGAACGGGETKPFGLESEAVIAAENAAAIEFAPDGRMFFGEQSTGNIRVVSADGRLQEEPFAHVDVALWLEWGLTGLAVDPEFSQNGYLYAYYTQPVQPEPLIGRPVVVRFTDRNNKGEEPKVILELADTAENHHGYNANGEIHFGPDGFLYVSVGDYDIPADTPSHPAQELSTPIGKLLRVNKEDGSAAPDNPFVGRADADPRVFAYGFREPFDFAFNPQGGAIYGTDNTPYTCEELNVIALGDNHSWPAVGQFPFSDCTLGPGKKGVYYLTKEGLQPGDYLSFVQVSALEFISGQKYATLGESLLVCEFGTGDQPAPQMRRLVLNAPTFDQVTSNDLVVDDCRLDIDVSPDGTIYYSNEKEIRRLLPPGQ